MVKKNSSIPASQTLGILVYDLKGYSKLNLDELKIFHKHVMKDLYDIVTGEYGDGKDEYIHMNTWGDGIILVHKDHNMLVHVGLQLKKYFLEKQYRSIRINGEEWSFFENVDLLPRIAVHAGFVDSVEDYFQEQSTVVGPEVILPARIEPIAKPGTVWVTSEIKVPFEKRQNDRKPGKLRIIFPEQGSVTLAKSYGDIELFEAVYEYEYSGPEEGSQGEDSANDPSKNRGGANNQKPPEKEPDLTEFCAKAIMALTNIDPTKDNIKMCSTIRNNDCPAKISALSLISQLTRHKEVACEEFQVATHIFNIYHLSNEAYEDLESNNKIEKTNIYGLREELNKFYTFFLNLTRNYNEQEEWDDDKKTERRPFEFLIRRFTSDDNDLITDFTDRLLELHCYLADSKIYDAIFFQQIENYDKQHLMKLLHDISVEAKPIAEFLFKNTKSKRVYESTSSVQKAFSNFDKFHLIRHIQNAIKGIPNPPLAAPAWPS